MAVTTTLNTMNTLDTQEPLWQWRYAVPPEKGAWIWWIGPLLMGAAAAQQLHWDLLPLILAATCAYLLRQPLTLAVKILWKGRNPRDLRPALFWAGMLGGLALAGAVSLLLLGHAWVGWMALLAGPLFVWHLWLVGRGEERHQLVLDLLAAAFLSLTAPAAYWAAGGTGSTMALTLWLVAALQTSASIVHMMLRLEQRRLKVRPDGYAALKKGALPWGHHAANLALALVFSATGHLPVLVPVAFALALAEGTEAILRPPFGRTPKQLGMRQLYMGMLFVGMVMAGFALQTR